MSHYGRPPRQAAYAVGISTAAYDRRRRRRDASAPKGSRAEAVTLERVANVEALAAAYDDRATFGGKAPGRDRVTYADMGRREAYDALRGLSASILAGEYRPAPSRTTKVPKRDGIGRRTLSLRGILDRVVSAALNRALSPAWEPTFLDNSHGFRPRRCVWTLLAALEVAMTQSGRAVLAQDDVRDAFPSVVIDDLMEDHRRHIRDPRLLALIEAVVRGGDDSGRALGLAQGDPYSPTALNVRLHATHDAPLARDATDCTWFRYADNVAYLCRSMPEGRDLLGRARELLRPAGFASKGEDGPPIDLRVAEAQLLGFRITWAGDRLRLRPGDDAWDELARHLGDAREDYDPDEAARRATLGWASSYGPAFETTTEIETIDRIFATATTQGFRELASPEGLRTRLRDAHHRWQRLRGGARPAAVGRHGDVDDVWRSAPTIAPGGPI